MSKAKRLLTPREAAEALGITVPELAALRRSGEAPEHYEITVQLYRSAPARVQDAPQEREHGPGAPAGGTPLTPRPAPLLRLPCLLIVLSKSTRDTGCADSERARYLRDTHALLPHLHSGFDALRGHHRRTSADATLSTRMSQAPASVLPNRRHAQLRKHGHDADNSFPHWRRRIDIKEGFGETAQPHAASAEIADQLDSHQFRAGDPIKREYHEGVTLA